MPDLKKTPLFPIHKSLGSKIVDFGGWALPVSYSSVLEEHKAVRSHCGIFDVSHMGELRVSGKNSSSFLQGLTINDVAKLSCGAGQYSAILNEQGGFIDDLIVYKLQEDDFLICVNASNIEKDYDWIESNANLVANRDLKITNDSSNFAQLAVQGPACRAVLSAVFPAAKELIENLPYTGIAPVTYSGKSIWIARTGYTGELGFELYLPSDPDLTASLWTQIMEAGARPCGLGCRDTLRLESCYLLYGNDMDETVTPLEAGIAWAIRWDAGEFIGKPSLLSERNRGPSRKLFAIRMEDAGIPRSGMDVYSSAGELIGKITSGSVLPTVGGAGGMALLSQTGLQVGDLIELDVRGKRKLARIAKRPLYSAKVKS